MGKNLVHALATLGDVVVFDREMPSEFASNDKLVCKTGDFVNITSFDDILEGVDVVYHLISTTLPSEGTQNTPKEVSENVLPMVHLLESMKRCSVKRIIFASSGGTVYGDTDGHINKPNDSLSPICSYGLQKQLIENCLMYYNRAGDLDCKIARITNPYGLGQRVDKPQGIIPILIYRLRNNMPITIYGDGTISRDFIYMEDLISALIALSTYNGKKNIFNFGYGESFSLNYIVNAIEQIAAAKFTEVYYQPLRKFDVPHVNVSIEETIAELSWKPQITLEMGIERIVRKGGYRNESI